MWFNNKSVSHLGIGVTLYFEYIKFTCFIFFLGSLCGTLSTLILNNFQFTEVDGYCSKGPYLGELEQTCQSFSMLKNDSILFQFTFRNDCKLFYHNFIISDYYSKIAELLQLNVIAIDLKYFHFYNVILMLLIVFSFYFLFVNYCSELDLQNETIEDYTAFISNIPVSANRPEISQSIESSGIKPADYLYCYNLEDYYKYKKDVEKYKEIIGYCNSKGITEYKSLFSQPILLSQAQLMLDISIQNVERMEKEFESAPDDPDDSMFTGTIFTFFKTEQDANDFKAKNKKSQSERMIKCLTRTDKENELSNYHIDNASEPSDIIWENLGYSFETKLKRTFLMNLLSLSLICISFLVLFVITQFQKEITNMFVKQFASLGFSLLINIINYVVSKVLIIAAKYEKPYSFSKYYFSASLKLTIFTFINTALNPLVSFRVSGMEDKDYKIFQSNLTMIFLINMLYPIYWLIDPMYLLKKYYISQAESHFEGIKKNKVTDIETNKDEEPLSDKYTQKELNQIFENPDFELFMKYSYLGKTLLMTLFLMSYFPLAPYMSGVGMVLLYAIEKYKVSSRYRKPEQLSGEISVYYVTLTKLGVALYFTMIIALDEVRLGESEFSKYLALVVCYLLCILPIEAMRDNFICFEDIASNDTFEKKYFTFGMNYEIINPVTKVLGINRYLDKMIKNKLLTQNEKVKFLRGEMGESVSNVIELYYSKVGQSKSAYSDILKRKSSISPAFRSMDD